MGGAFTVMEPMRIGSLRSPRLRTGALGVEPKYVHRRNWGYPRRAHPLKKARKGPY